MTLGSQDIATRLFVTEIFVTGELGILVDFRGPKYVKMICPKYPLHGGLSSDTVVWFHIIYFSLILQYL